MELPCLLIWGVSLVLVGIYHFWRGTTPHYLTGAYKSGVNASLSPIHPTRRIPEEYLWGRGTLAVQLGYVVRQCFICFIHPWACENQYLSLCLVSFWGQVGNFWLAPRGSNHGTNHHRPQAVDWRYPCAVR